MKTSQSSRTKHKVQSDNITYCGLKGQLETAIKKKPIAGKWDNSAHMNRPLGMFFPEDFDLWYGKSIFMYFMYYIKKLSSRYNRNHLGMKFVDICQGYLR